MINTLQARSPWSEKRPTCDDVHVGTWHPVHDDGCYRPSQSYSWYALQMGATLSNWPEGMQVRNRRGKVMTFTEGRWHLDRLDVLKALRVIG